MVINSAILQLRCVSCDFNNALCIQDVVFSRVALHFLFSSCLAAIVKNAIVVNHPFFIKVHMGFDSTSSFSIFGIDDSLGSSSGA